MTVPHCFRKNIPSVILLLLAVHLALPSFILARPRGTAKSEEFSGLLENLQSKDLSVRTAAVTAIAGLGDERLNAAPSLIESVRPQSTEEAYFWNGNYRRAVVETLAGMGHPVLPTLNKYLHAKTSRERYVAALALNVLEPENIKKKIIPMVLNGLDDKNIARRREAVLTLGELGVNARPAVPDLIKLMETARLDQRNPKFKRQESALGFLRAETAEALGKIRAEEAVPALINEIRPDPAYLTFDKKSDVHFFAADALVKIGSPAVPALTRALHDDNPAFREEVASVLGRLGEKAKSSSLAIRYLLRTDDIILNPLNKEVKTKLVKALEQVDPSAMNNAVTVIKTRELKYSDDQFAELIKNTPPEELVKRLDKTTLDSFSRALQHKDVMARRRASEVLKSMGAAAKETVPALAWALFDEDAQVRLNATNALGNMEEAAREAAPYLAQVLLQSDVPQKLEAVAALSKINPDDENVIYQMLHATKDKNRQVRQSTRDVLTKIGLSHPDSLERATLRVQNE